MKQKFFYQYCFIFLFFGINTLVYSNEMLHFLDNKIHSNFSNTAFNTSKNRKLYYNIYFILQTAIAENADLSNLDESTQYTTIQTDDRTYFGLYKIGFSMKLQITNSFFFYWDIFQEGFLGNNISKNENREEKKYILSAKNPQFSNAFLEKVIINTKENFLSIKLGRQLFQIEEQKIKKEYLFKNYLDAVVLTYTKTKIGGFRFLVVNFLHLHNNNLSNINYTQHFLQTAPSNQNFRGEQLSLQFGFTYETPNFFAWENIFSKTPKEKDIRLKLYSFYVYYGAVSSTGQDVHEGDNSYNQKDKDWVMNAGLRLSVYFKILSLYIDVNYSLGVDHKNQEQIFSQNFDSKINANGISFVFTFLLQKIHINSKYQIHLGIDFIYKQGASYNNNGKLTSYGFVGFHSDQIGGILLKDYWGIYASVIADNNGFYYDPYSFERASGTMLLYLQISQQIFQKFTIHLESWFLWDSGKTKLILNTIDEVKSNTFMGIEMDVSFSFIIDKHWNIVLTYGVFFPAKFYHLPRIQIQAPNGQDIFWMLKIESITIF